MRPVQVVVVPTAELSMPLVDDHRAVEEIAADGAEEGWAIAVGPRHSPRRLATARGASVVAGVTSSPRRPGVRSSRVSTAIRARSLQLSLSLLVRRRSTARRSNTFTILLSPADKWLSAAHDIGPTLEPPGQYE